VCAAEIGVTRPNHESVVSAASRVLSTAFNRHIELGDATCLTDEERRNVILRCRNLSGGAPDTCIIKQTASERFNPDDGGSADVVRLFNDWAGYEFVTAASVDRPLCARFYAGDREQGIFVIEDLGPHRSLVEPLLDGDARVEDVLTQFSARLGQLHAATLGQCERFEMLFKRLSPAAFAARDNWLRAANPFPELPACLDSIGLALDERAGDELRVVASAIQEPGQFLAYVHADPCPDNVFVAESDLRFIDFEFGGFGHALVDATYPRMMFPSCWCANRLPDAVVARLESVYRGELSKRCMAAQDDRLFERALVSVCAFWLFRSFNRLFERGRDADPKWGISTIRQRLIARLEAFVDVSESFQQLPNLRGVAERAHAVLTKRWPETEPLPLYPAFRVR
jgi:hypothetical protein